MNKYLVFIGIGFELILLILVAIYIGQSVLSSQMGTVGLIFGALIGWMVHIFYLFRRL